MACSEDSGLWLLFYSVVFHCIPLHSVVFCCSLLGTRWYQMQKYRELHPRHPRHPRQAFWSYHCVVSGSISDKYLVTSLLLLCSLGQCCPCCTKWGQCVGQTSMMNFRAGMPVFLSNVLLLWSSTLAAYSSQNLHINSKARGVLGFMLHLCSFTLLGYSFAMCEPISVQPRAVSPSDAPKAAIASIRAAQLLSCSVGPGPLWELHRAA